MTLIELAERCEQATGPDRELDVYIALATGELEHSEFYEPESLYGDKCHAYSGTAYTTSIDAAMTLMPEGYERIQQEQVRMQDGSIRCWASIDGWPVSPRRCATPALALCAAALRARAAQ